jgi:putative glycosyltransferase (TIGR04372 family)
MFDKVIKFKDSQIQQIIKGGWSVFLKKIGRLFVVLIRKIYKIFTFSISLPITFLIVIIIRLLRPFVLVRFGYLEGNRIGHFAQGAEIYLCERNRQKSKKKVYDIFYVKKPVSNYQLEKMWKRVLHIPWFSAFIPFVIILNRCFLGYKEHLIPMEYDKNIHESSANIKAHLSFTSREKILARGELKRIGVPEGIPFVCFHAREAGYLDKLFPSHDWRYHDYRDSDINNYLAAANELTKRGYFVLRMGAGVREPLVMDNPKIIDYAYKYRSDFLDIFLAAKCHFFIGSQCGITEIPRIFRRRVAWVNCVPLEYIFHFDPGPLFIFKKIWAQEKNRFLTVREILDSGAGNIDHSCQYKQIGLKVVENTSQEIVSLAVEMDKRIEGAWQSSGEDEQLQRLFWDMMSSSKFYRKITARVGTEFLRGNRELLG